MVSVLYVRKDSVYKDLDVDCWDMVRDARKWPGGNPVVAHPPCRAWGQLAHFANPRPDEKDLAIHAIEMIRKHGGVLEHPRASKLWKHLSLPMPGKGYDEYGGFSLCVNQSWWGHKAEKNTLLYIVGIKQKDIPSMPIKLDAVEYVVSTAKRNKHGRRDQSKKEITKKEREQTPLLFAKWLIELAGKCKV